MPKRPHDPPTGLPINENPATDASESALDLIKAKELKLNMFPNLGRPTNKIDVHKFLKQVRIAQREQE